MGAGTQGILHLIGGVAVLLWGLRMVRTGAMRALGDRLRSAVRHSTKNRLVAVATGFSMTALVQSSTAVVLLISSFASRGVIKTGPALATVLGADVGTTIVAQILSFDLRLLIPFSAVTGLVIFTVSEKKSSRNIGRILLGLAFMLIGLQQILGASSPMRESALIQHLISALQDELLLALLLAALMTWLSHSSLAMVLLVMSLGAAGHIPLDLAIVFVLGINIGGTLPALSATLAEPVEGRRVAVGNLLFRLTGVILVLPFLRLVMPYLAQIEAAPARQIANFHTLFNVAVLLVFLPCTHLMERLVERLLPRPVEILPEADAPLKPVYLDEADSRDVNTGLNNATREALRMGDVVYQMMLLSLDAFKEEDQVVIKKIAKLEDDVDRLNEAIKFYVTDISQARMSRADSERCMTVVNYVTNLEHIGDLIERNLLELAVVKQKKGLHFSSEGIEDIEVLHERLVRNLQMSFNLFLSQDELIAEQLLSEKRDFKNAQLEATQRHIERLQSGRPESRDTSAIHLDLLRDFKQINSHITALAYSILQSESNRLLPLREAD